MLGGGMGHHCDSSSHVVLPPLPLTPSVLPPHTHPRSIQTYGSFSRHVSSSHVKRAHACKTLYVDGECGCARVFLCVSVLEKADLRELCSTFTLLLIHPFALTVVARLDRMGGETKRVQEGRGGN